MARLESIGYRLREHRRAALLDHVGDERQVEGAADGAHLLHALWRLDEEDVGAGLRVGLGAAQGLVEPERGARIGAGDDEEVLRGARLGGHADLLHHVRRPYHAPPRRVAALLREFLVLELDGRRAGFLVAAHGVAHV
jgi:hypothetical protein